MWQEDKELAIMTSKNYNRIICNWADMFVRRTKAYARRERHKANKNGRLQLVNDAFYLIGSAVFQCMKHHVTTEVWNRTFIFLRY
jgi:hypothetical protein